MELGQYQIQIFVSLFVILGAAFVALICDFLKGNNEQLRELTIELKVRREEDQRRLQVMTAQPLTQAQPLMVGAGAAVASIAPVMEASAPKPAAKESRIESAPRAMAAPKERKRTASADAIAAMERGAAMAGARRPKAAEEPAEPVRHERAVPVESTPVVELNPEAARRPVPVAPQTAFASGPKKDWNALLNRQLSEKKPVEVRTDLMQAVAAATISQRNTAGDTQDAAKDFPAGFHDGFVLSQLVQSRKPVSGLVVSIGVNAPRNEDGSLPENVVALIHTLIGPDDFACQASAEEFLLIYPGERGAAAQRRLSQIAQQLWDFQLRSLGEFSILFSWGGVEVRSESIDEAIASANERMQETRRGRKLLTMEPRHQEALRQAV
jgi:hypothetical protein